MPGKKVTAQTLIGQRRINLIERRVLEMGSLWYPTGGYEAGIDGHIELRDPTTGEALNITIRVQSRATKGQFEAETAAGFDYTCTEKDLSYWLSGNAAVILVRSRPEARQLPSQMKWPALCGLLTSGSDLAAGTPPCLG